MERKDKAMGIESEQTSSGDGGNTTLSVDDDRAILASSRRVIGAVIWGCCAVVCVCYRVSRTDCFSIKALSHLRVFFFVFVLSSPSFSMALAFDWAQLEVYWRASTHAHTRRGWHCGIERERERERRKRTLFFLFLSLFFACILHLQTDREACVCTTPSMSI